MTYADGWKMVFGNVALDTVTAYKKKGKKISFPVGYDN